MTQQGSIVRWDATRALGFIRSGDCAGDVFFHLHDYQGATPPREGLAVGFEESTLAARGRVPWRCARLLPPRAPPTTPAAATAGASPASRAGQRQGKAPSPATFASLAYGL